MRGYVVGQAVLGLEPSTVYVLCTSQGRALARPAAQPAGRRLASVDRRRDVLGLEVLLDALAAALAPDAGLLDPAERRRGVGDHPLVEAHHAGLQPLDDAEGALEVGRVDVGDEAELRVVGGGERLVLGLEALDRRDGAEDLLLEQPRVLG